MSFRPIACTGLFLFAECVTGGLSAQLINPRIEIEHQMAAQDSMILLTPGSKQPPGVTNTLAKGSSPAAGPNSNEAAPRGGAPANDDCVDAEIIAAGTLSFSTSDATTDGPTDSLCDFGFQDGGAVNSDIWYAWQADVDGRAMVSTCGSGYDTKVAIYLGECPSVAHQAIACDEDLCQPGMLQSWVSWDTMAGATYYIRVGGFDGDQGSGTLTLVSSPAPTNDDCLNATLVDSDATVVISNIVADESIDEPEFQCAVGGSASGQGTLWYKFISPHGSAHITTCGSTDADDTLLALYDGEAGCPLTTLNEVGCGEDECGLSPRRLSQLCIGSLEPGRTYYIQVATFSNAGRGEIQLEITSPCPIGPDIVVGELYGAGTSPSHSQWNIVRNWGRQVVNSVGITGYSVGTMSCNPGDVEVSWNVNNNKHPVIGQQLYRLKDGRFEQVGMSWVKHGFLALSEDYCDLGCIEPEQSGVFLGLGCSDPYTNQLNGTQTRLGPRGHINAFTGSFPYPFTSPNVPFPPPNGSGLIAERLQVKDADIDPDVNTGARYFVEGHYVTSDDATLGNGLNNASYQEALVTVQAANVFNMTLTGTDQLLAPGISAWKSIDPDVVESIIDVPNEGRFILSARATDLGGGMWHYEYALHNYNSDRSGRTFTVPVPAGIAVTNVGFNDVDYHSGDSLGTVSGAIDNTDWPPNIGAASVSWATSTYASNRKANALRWATLYNFRFDAGAPPTTGDITIGLFKPGTIPSVSGSTIVPGEPPPPPCSCRGDVDGSTLLDGADIDLYVQMFLEQTSIEPCAEMTGSPGQPLDDDDTVEFVFRLLDGTCTP